MIRHRRWIPVSALAVLSVAAYPVVFLYAHNAAELAPGELWRPLGIVCATALMILAVLRALAGPRSAAVLLTQVAVLLGAYYRPLENALRGQWAFVRYWHLAPSLGLAVLLAAVATRGLSTETRHAIASLGRRVALVFATLLGLNVVLALPHLRTHARERASVFADRETSAEVAPDVERPNVYYIILDEYSGFGAIQRHYGYDNSEFLRFLRDHGFNVSLTSRNRTSATNIEVTNIMGMGPVVSERTPEAERYARYRQGGLLRFFERLGYTSMVVNTVWQDYVSGDITYRGSGWLGQTDGHGESLPTLMLGRSILHPLELATVSSPSYIHEAFETLRTASQRPGPLFVFSHMRCPHEPFLFDAEGRTVSPEHHHNWRDKRHYLGFFQYATARTREMVKAILDHDPGAVILLQSDHSARARERLTGRVAHPIPQEDLLEILNAVYIRGLPLDIEGLDGLETSLRVYAELFGPVATGEVSHE